MDPKLAKQIEAADATVKALTSAQLNKLERIKGVLEGATFTDFYRPNGLFEEYITGDLPHRISVTVLEDEQDLPERKRVKSRNAADRLILAKLAVMFNTVL